MHMVSRNIYVADSDVELFDTAAALSGSLSAAVAAGLRLYVDQQRKAKEATQMRPIEVEVQDGPVVSIKRFTGRQLLRYEMRADGRVTTFRVYLTARDQIAVFTRNDPDWAKYTASGEDEPIWNDPKTWSTAWWDTTERALRVFSDIDALNSELPDELVQATRRALAEPATEDIDI